MPISSFFFQAEDGIRDLTVTGVQTCALPISARGATLVFISHDLAVVRYLADTVAVMYLGTVVELGPVERVFTPPYHPYTEALLSAVPVPDPDRAVARILLEGRVPSAGEIPPGCPFATRCPR